MDYSGLPTNRLRGLVSKKKRRFQEHGFDLDLTYITDNIIAMGFPSEKLEGIYRNPMSEVQRFLDQLHKDHYKVYNLCSERRYDHKKFYGRVFEFPFDDHNPCALDRIDVFCKNVHDWVESDPTNVAVIHCKAGKGRTGMVICCYLQYAGKCRSASEALQLFATRRTKNQKGVTLHSQLRYVRYYEHVLQNGKPPQKFLRLERIRMHTIPDMKKGGGSNPWFSIFQGETTLYYSDPVKGKKGNQVVDFECGNTILTNDIKIEFFHKNLKGRMFYFWFHCSFVVNNYFCLRKRDLERACKDKSCKHFQPGFKIELYFSEHESSSSQEPGAHRSICTGCAKVIEQTDPSVSLDKGIYHIRCLCCEKCGSPFSGTTQCIIKDSKAICQRCEGEQFFTRCVSCMRPLTDQKIIEQGDSGWHFDCFRCVFCKKLFEFKHNQEYVFHDNLPYCPEHVGFAAGMICQSAKCNHPQDLQNIISALGKTFHKECFTCIECGRVLNSSMDSYFEKDGFPCCQHHNKPILCYLCSENIPRFEVVSALNENWHRRCFRCQEANCSQSWDVETCEEFVELRQGKPVCKHHGLLTCSHCSKTVSGQDLLQIENQDWHKNCFKCNVCGMILNHSSEYFFEDGLPSCASHQRICFECQQNIRPDDLIQALNENWHRNCFRCQMEGCGELLEEGDYLQVNNLHFCSRHPHCTKCRSPIPDHEVYHDHNGQFHRRCFCCAGCSTPLDPDNCGFHGRQLMCPDCHPAPKCDGCGKILEQGHIAVLTRHYHIECFLCSKCEEPFASVTEAIAVAADGKPICASCSAILCEVCQKPILEKVLQSQGASFHPDCFRCCSCREPMRGNYGMVDEVAYCAGCLSAPLLPNCDVCNNGVKSDPFVLLAKRPVHKSCFVCNKCHAGIFYLSDYQRQGKQFTCEKCAYPNRANKSASVREQNLLPQSAALPSSRAPSVRSPPVQAPHNDNWTKIEPLPLSETEAPVAKALEAPMAYPSEGPRPASFVASKALGSRTLRSSVASHRQLSFDSEISGSPRGSSSESKPETKEREGYLRKEGGRVKNMKRRYFILKGNTLTYSVSPNDPPLGVIALTKDCKINLNLSKKRIELQTLVPARLWKFVGEDEADVQSWYHCLIFQLAKL